MLPIPAPLVTILSCTPPTASGKNGWQLARIGVTLASSSLPRKAASSNRATRTACSTTCAPKANVPQLRVHDLRHSCATLLFTMGVQPATVQRILRHSSITVTTGTYVEVIEAVQRDALDSMSSLFDGHTGVDAK